MENWEKDPALYSQAGSFRQIMEIIPHEDGKRSDDVCGRFH